MFTRDEENGLSGIRNANLKNFKSKYVLVLDSDTLGQCEVSGASYTLAKIKVHSFKGGTRESTLEIKPEQMRQNYRRFNLITTSRSFL